MLTCPPSQCATRSGGGKKNARRRQPCKYYSYCTLKQYFFLVGYTESLVALDVRHQLLLRVRLDAQVGEDYVT